MGSFFLFRTNRMPTQPVGPHPTTLRKRPQKPSYTKGTRGKRSLLAKQVAREVCGFAPYEKRAIELLRNSLDKRALRVCKRSLVPTRELRQRLKNSVDLPEDNKTNSSAKIKYT